MLKGLYSQVIGDYSKSTYKLCLRLVVKAKLSSRVLKLKILLSNNKLKKLNQL